MAYFSPFLDNVSENLQAEIHESGRSYDVKDYPVDEKVTKLPVHREIQLQDITYRYPRGNTYVFRNADVTFKVGESIGIVGPSGAGKTTIIDIMLGLLHPESGKVLADGVDVQSNYKGWLRNIGYIPQSIFMFNTSIRKNVAFGVPEEDIEDEKVWKALKQAQIDDFVRSQKYGLDSGIGERGVRISGGQRQRIGIARALYNDPEIMIFDEATSALDNDTETAIMEAIEALHGKKTLIIVAHRLTTIQNCDYVYRVDHQGFTLQEDLGRGQPLRGQAD